MCEGRFTFQKLLVYLFFEGPPKFCYLFTKKKLKMVLDKMMMIIKKEKENKEGLILYFKMVKQLVTTYPPLGSGQNSKTKKWSWT